MKKIRVLIVEDSIVSRRVLVEIVSSDPRLEVVAEVGSAEEALAGLPDWRPDVITMDLRLPGLSGIEATRRIMSTWPTPIVVVAGASRPDEVDLTPEAMKAGVVLVLTKPDGLSREGFGRMARLLCNQLVIMSQVRVIRQTPTRPPLQLKVSYAVKGTQASSAGEFRYLGLVASTGGPAAVARLLTGLGAGFGLPILLVQHIAPSYIESFRSWLDGVCPMPVKIASEGERPAAGTVYLAPPDTHLALAPGGTLRLDTGPPFGLMRPSGNVLLSSLALLAKRASIGVLLTGMGDDGAQGLLEIRTAGGFTISEHESTTVVHGMPAAAERLGAAIEILPLHHIAARLQRLLG